MFTCTRVYKQIVQLVTRMEAAAEKVLSAAWWALELARAAEKHCDGLIARTTEGYKAGSPEQQLIRDLATIHNTREEVWSLLQQVKEHRERFEKIVPGVEMRVLKARDLARHDGDPVAATAALDSIFGRALLASRKLRKSILLSCQAAYLLKSIDAVTQEFCCPNDIHKRVAWFVTSRNWFDGEPRRISHVQS